MSTDEKKELVLSERFAASLMEFILEHIIGGGLTVYRAKEAYGLLSTNLAKIHSAHTNFSEEFHFNLLVLSAKSYFKSNNGNVGDFHDFGAILQDYKSLLDLFTDKGMPRLVKDVDHGTALSPRRDRASDVLGARKGAKAPTVMRQFFAELDRSVLIDIVVKGMKSPDLLRQFILAAGDELFERNEKGIE